MRHPAKILVMVLSVIACCRCSCDQSTGIDRDFLENGTIGLRVAGTNRFMYEPADCQLGFNSTLKQFRAGNDTGTDFFTLTCSELPVQVGQKIKADLVYTRHNGITRENGLSFSVEQIQGDKIWMWSSAKKIAVCVQLIR